MAGVVAADPVDACVTLVAYEAVAGIEHARAVAAGLPPRTTQLDAAVGDAVPIYALLTKDTAHLSAAAGAPALAAELAGVAEEVGAGIGLADEVDASLPLRTAGGVAVVGYAGPRRARLSGRTVDARARIGADPVVADLSFVALGEIAGVRADALEAAQLAGALIVRADRRAVAEAAGLTLGARRVVVDVAVAVVVLAVADLERRGSAETTIVPQPLVDRAIAVLVSSIAALGAW